MQELMFGTDFFSLTGFLHFWGIKKCNVEQEASTLLKSAGKQMGLNQLGLGEKMHPAEGPRRGVLENRIHLAN